MIDIVLLYPRIIVRAEPSLPMPFPYSEGERRWLSTYNQFRPKIPHKVLIVNCGSHTDYDQGFDEIAYSYAYYDGLGSDCGTFQAIGKTLDSDLVVCFNTLAYLWRPNWLEPFAEAFRTHGKGVYGATASYESHPHLRTPCIAFAPQVMREYPHLCDARLKAIQFESGPENFSLWAERQGYPTLLVTEGMLYNMKHWRDPVNGFRRGDQSDCLVWDRHTLLWEKSPTEEKEALTKSADTLTT